MSALRAVGVLFLTITFLLLYFSKCWAAEGEPIPGAEIYVELEPDDEPICDGETNGEGEYIFSVLLPGYSIPSGPDIPGITVSVTIPAKAWDLLGKKLNRAGLSGTYVCILTVKVNNKTYQQKFSAVRNDPKSVDIYSCKLSQKIPNMFSDAKGGGAQKITMTLHLNCSAFQPSTRH
jgi:hypothetical protein